jgi:hypothetical protein
MVRVNEVDADDMNVNEGFVFAPYRNWAYPVFQFFRSTGLSDHNRFHPTSLPFELGWQISIAARGETDAFTRPFA